MSLQSILDQSNDPIWLYSLCVSVSVRCDKEAYLSHISASNPSLGYVPKFWAIWIAENVSVTQMVQTAIWAI